MNSIKTFIESRFNRDIRGHIVLEKREGIYNDFPEALNPLLKEKLVSQGITRLYSHQYDAFESISSNRNTLLVSSTASGKTLSFFLPVLNEYSLADRPFSVLLLYPTKALSRDQEGSFVSLMRVLNKNDRVGTFDGDTPADERSRIQKSVDFIITNPDMLHSGILPNHNRKWRVFLSRLRYIIIDEVHTYRGSFGSHVSNVFRRLVRICGIHGSSPIFVCSSATIGNPEEHVRALFHADFHAIDKDSSPRPVKEFYFINPPIVEDADSAFLYRKGPAYASVPIIREAMKNRMRTICFCRARQEVERLHRAVTDGVPELRDIIKPYRGGLLPGERRQLERDLMRGRLLGIISTNALELGIDIGDLDLCIISGHPGTIASFWQQAGRVGRKTNSSIVVFIAKDRPIDQYLVHHTNFIIKAPIELAWLNADNPYIILQHLPCAAQEYPLREIEKEFNTDIYAHSLDVLKKSRIVIPYHGSYRYALQDYASRGVNLRGMTDYNVDIYCGSEVIGEIDPIGARGTLYKDAIYQHLGGRYMSLELDLDKKLCRVEKVDVDYYTEAVWEGRVEMTDEFEKKELNSSLMTLGNIYVNKQPKLYKKIKERTFENIGYGPITLPAFEYDTTGFGILPPEEWLACIRGTDMRYIGAGIFGLSYILRHTSPSICMADVEDIDTSVSLSSDEIDFLKTTLFIFDTIEGGVGYSEKIYEKIEECMRLCLDVINECECDSLGCPSCVPPLPPGIVDGELESFLIETNAAAECTKSLLNSLLYGRIIIPEIKTIRTHIKAEIKKPEEDIEKIRLKKKLDNAIENLKKKKERLH